jgi:elongation factor P
MISTGDLKKGIAIELEDTLYTIVDFAHIKMGRGSAQVRLKLRDVKGGHTIERTFQAGEKFPRARLVRQSAQYLYADGDVHHFMNTDTYDQVALNGDQLGDALQYLRENATCEVLIHGDQPIGVELPAAVELAVAETDPWVKGDTAQGGTKPAKMETGIMVQVPLFINSGDVIKVDTRSGQYLERVST